MRADRLLSILLQLQVHRRLTARALARRLEVSERTIHRDMEALSAAGIPVYAERGAGGGWVLPDSFRTDVTGLTDAEIRALVVATPARPLADLGLDKASDAALVKLLAALPTLARRDAEYARQRLYVDPTGWRRADEAVPFLTILQEAIWQERRVRLTYQRADGQAVERTVDPFGLVAKGSRWYLVAGVDGTPRTYRVSRVHAVALLDEACIRPPDFDLAAFWAASTVDFVAALPRYPIAVRVAPDVVRRLWIPGAYAQIQGLGDPEPDGWQTARLVLQTLEEACAYVLGFGTGMAVVEPVELRERVVRTAREIATFYDRAPCRQPDRSEMPGLACAASNDPPSSPTHRPCCAANPCAADPCAADPCAVDPEEDTHVTVCPRPGSHASRRPDPGCAGPL
ncbi:MAG: YafY family transcriptional regulator [Chloroflexi bacterium]|nr:YafY family transcriptional regulator [Chloroflexota bacterium]